MPPFITQNTTNRVSRSQRTLSKSLRAQSRSRSALKITACTQSLLPVEAPDLAEDGSEVVSFLTKRSFSVLSSDSITKNNPLNSPSFLLNLQTQHQQLVQPPKATFDYSPLHLAFVADF
ncbi:hypothetical protein GQX74_003166 [Glossina fuscipes]|nr:hypothetical protein GQX74_003166 [Glossina fuscipes]